MYYERKFDFQVAARKRVSGDQTPSVCSPAAKHPPQGSSFSVARPDPTPSDRRDRSPFTPNASQAASHGFLIVTPRLEFPATVTKQSPDRISNRYKIAVSSSGFPAPARNRQKLSPPEFLIANLELEFFLSVAKSTKYKFLIANKRGFCVRRGGSRFCAPESRFAYRTVNPIMSNVTSVREVENEKWRLFARSIPYPRPLLPDFLAAARLTWQELICGSCHTFHRRLDHVWTLKMGHDQA